MSVASKNLFELLGNDPDSDGEIKVPTREVIKQTTSTKKKDVVVETPPPAAARTGGRGGRGRNTSGTDAAFHDRNAGREYNRSKDTTESGEAPRHSGARGGRGGRGRNYDRHSQTGRVDTDKQVSQGWGSNDKEWTEEKAGESIAQAEATSENAAVASGEPEVVGEAEVTPAEPEEKVKTYQDYLAEVAAKQAALNPLPQARQPNEGSRTDSKWKNAVPVKKSEEDEEAYFAGKEAKARKEKERKQKLVVEIDQRFQEAPRGGRGGSERGRGRGGAERGERRGGPRGGRGDGGFRGGERRGGYAPRNNAGPAVNLNDTSAFPSLGSK